MYNKIYLDDAMNLLGDMCEYVVSDLHMDLDEFWKLFLISGYAQECAMGNCAIVAGKSGVELAMDVLIKVGYADKFPKASIFYDRSEYFWAGWILSYYQWRTGYSYHEIYRHIKMETLIDMYTVNHEMGEERVSDNIDILMKTDNSLGKIAYYRRIFGYSQRILAQKSGVNLRTLQQYEIGAKDVNKASAVTLKALASVLNCRIEDLMN